MEPMIAAHEQVGTHRYRESYGLHYEEFVVGDVFEHRPGRTVTELDNIWQSLMNMNHHPAHIDAVYARRTEFERLLVNSSITLSIVSGMTVATMPPGLQTASMCWANIRSAFFPEVGHHPQRKRSGYSMLALV